VIAAKARVLALVHKDLVPKENVPPKDVNPEWRMEWDVVTTLKSLGHDVLVIGVHDDLTPIRQAIESFQPTIVFNMMEAFADIGVFDQNIVSYRMQSARADSVA
jgi:D-alanine-D-alanine ligase